MDISRLHKLFKKFHQISILVVGDIMIDEYLWGQVERISPEAPVPVVEVEKDAYALGGAGNVLNNLASLESNVLISSAIGQGPDARLLKNLLKDLDVDLAGIFSEKGRITTRKTRLLAAMNKQVIRFDRESTWPIEEKTGGKIFSYVRKSIDQVDGIILSDYNKGVLTDRLITKIISLAKKADKPVIIDSKRGFAEKKVYRGATMMTPNLKEASRMVGYSLGSEEEIVAAAKQLLAQLELDAILITRSAEGMTLLEKGCEPVNIPARAREVYDVSGAGDTVIAAVSLGLASGASYEESASLANIAGGVAVGKVGTAAVTRNEIMQYMGDDRIYSDHKILDKKNLKNTVNSLHIRGASTAFTFGFFDPFNMKYIKFLQNARRFGKTLIVGISDDASFVRKNKGRRPSLSEEERLHIISALDCVNYVFLYQEKDLPRLLHLISPDNVVVEKEGQDLSFYQGSIQKL